MCKPDGAGFFGCECGGSGGAGPAGPGSTTGTNGPGGGNEGGQGGGVVCAPAAVEDCYDGPSATEDVGPCVGGTRICGVDGTWGACMGQVLPAGEDCQTAADDDCDGQTPACAAPWALALGEASSVLSAARDAAGNVYILGQFDGTVDFGGGNTLTDVGNQDVFVAKLSPSGVHEWSFQLGDPIDTVDGFGGLAVDPSGVVYVSVGFAGTQTFLGTQLQSEGDHDIALLRILPDGTPDAIVSYGSMQWDHVYTMTVDMDGNLILGVWHGGPIYFGGPEVLQGASFAVVKLESDLSHVFEQNIFPMSGGAELAVDPTTNDVVLVGAMYGQTDLGMGVVSSFVDGELFTARLSETGTVLSYAATGGPTGNIEWPQVSVLSNGDVVIRAEFYGTFDNGQDPPLTQLGGGADNWILFRQDSAGNVAWINQYYSSGPGSTLGSYARTAISPSDSIVITGQVSGMIDLGAGVITDQSFVLTLDASGAYQDVITVSNLLYPAALTLSLDGVPIIAGGYFGGPIDVAGTTLPMTNAGSSFVARLAP